MIYALGYNLLLGYCGLPSFGHGAFFGVGAYAFGLLQKQRVGRTCGSTSPARVLAAALRARWSRRSSRTGAASTTRC